MYTGFTTRFRSGETTWEACSGNLATWHLGYHLSICSWTQENQEKPASRWPVAGPSGPCPLDSTSCNTQSSAPEDGQNNCPKHVELIGIINKPLLLHLVGCLYYSYHKEGPFEVIAVIVDKLSACNLPVNLIFFLNRHFSLQWETRPDLMLIH